MTNTHDNKKIAKKCLQIAYFVWEISYIRRCKADRSKEFFFTFENSVLNNYYFHYQKIFFSICRLKHKKSENCVKHLLSFPTAEQMYYSWFSVAPKLKHVTHDEFSHLRNGSLAFFLGKWLKGLIDNQFSNNSTHWRFS